MADTTWGTRMPEELKEKIGNMLKESGLSGKEFMESLINMYELQQVKDVRAELLPDIDELEALVKRLCSIYVNMGERVHTIITDKKNTYQTDMAEKIAEIDKYKGQVKEVNLEKEELINKSVQLEANMASIEKEKGDMENRLNNEIKQLSEVNQSSKALVEEYKQKNDTLSGLLTEYKEYKDKNEKINEELKDTYKEIDKLTLKVKELGNALNVSNDKIIHVEERYKQQIENIQKALVFEKDKALLEYEKKMNNQIQEFRNKHNAELAEYNAKIKELLKELEARQKVVAEKKI